jgi:tetratricopeptide (TPR) repeat protein
LQKTVFSLLLLFSLQIISAQKIDDKKQISSLLNKARFSFFNLEGEKSLTYAKEALKLSHNIGDDVLMAKAYNIIGLNFQEFSEPKLSISYFKKGLAHAEKTKNDSVKLWLNNNIASVYTYKGIDTNLSLKHYEQALIYAKKINDSSEINYNQLNICNVYFRGVLKIHFLQKSLISTNSF